MKQKNNELPLIPKKSFWVRLREEKYLQVMALLGIVWMLIFNYIPMYGILIAFKKNFFITTPLFSKKFFTTPWADHHGFQHFLNFFKDEEFFNVMANTLGISILKLIFNFTLPIVFALLLMSECSLNPGRLLPDFGKRASSLIYFYHVMIISVLDILSQNGIIPSYTMWQKPLIVMVVSVLLFAVIPYFIDKVKVNEQK